MIDIHTHILPGVDDGCKTVEESILMLQKEAEQGISEVVLTPHFYASQSGISKFLERRSKAWGCLKPYLSENLPQLWLGAEVQYFEGICAVDGLDDLRIEGTELLLLEMPFSKWTDRMIRDVLELNDRDGIQILLAHVERYIPYQSENILPELLEEGVLFQSNTSFFTRWQTRYRAFSMLNQGMIYALGSDCHDLKSRPPAWASLPAKVRKMMDCTDPLHDFGRLSQDEVFLT